MKAQVIDIVLSQMKRKFLIPFPTLKLNWGPTFPQLPPPRPLQTDKLIAKSGLKYKFWDFEAQIVQIFGTMLDPLPHFGGAGEM